MDEFTQWVLAALIVGVVFLSIVGSSCQEKKLKSLDKCIEKHTPADCRSLYGVPP